MHRGEGPGKVAVNEAVPTVIQADNVATSFLLLTAYIERRRAKPACVEQFLREWSTTNGGLDAYKRSLALPKVGLLGKKGNSREVVDCGGGLELAIFGFGRRLKAFE